MSSKFISFYTEKIFPKWQLCNYAAIGGVGFLAFVRGCIHIFETVYYEWKPLPFYNFAGLAVLGLFSALIVYFSAVLWRELSTKSKYGFRLQFAFNIVGAIVCCCAFVGSFIWQPEKEILFFCIFQFFFVLLPFVMHLLGLICFSKNKFLYLS